MFLSLMLLSQVKWTPPYEAVTPPTDISQFTKRLGQNSTGLFVDHDILTAISRGKKNPLMIMDWFRSAMTAVEGSDVWISQTKMKDWDRAFFQYGVRDANDKLEWHEFRGRRAPQLPVAAKTLKGSVKKYTLDSVSLAEKRDVYVYLPPVPMKDIPVVVMADGSYCEEFAKVLEPFILSRKIKPIAILGVPSGGYRGPKDKFDFNLDFRMREYLKVADPDRFAQHLNFVCDQVLPWARSEFHVTSKREDTAVFGFSNGGAFSMVATLDRPDTFGQCLSFSVAAFDPKALAENAKKGLNSKFTFVAGKLELFIVNTENAKKILAGSGVTCSLQEHVSGHDMSMWKLGFVDALKSAFPAKP